MAKPRRIPEFFWRVMSWFNPRISKRVSSSTGPSQLVLVLSTTGRKSGRAHKTPLQYELVNGKYYVGSARGTKADWYRNLLAHPDVTFEVSGKEISARAEAITDPARIADFLELRLERHPRMMSLMMRLEGLPADFTRDQLQEFASHRALVILHPSS
jgi:deazaflavin-dependent oxidoreductase (nitroreductase family)